MGCWRREPQFQDRNCFQDRISAFGGGSMCRVLQTSQLERVGSNAESHVCGMKIMRIVLNIGTEILASLVTVALR